MRVGFSKVTPSLTDDSGSAVSKSSMLRAGLITMCDSELVEISVPPLILGMPSRHQSRA